MAASGALPALGADGFALVVDLLECDPPIISGALLVDAFPEAGQRLIDCGALRPIANAGLVTCRACDADHPAEVEFDAFSNSYRHFCNAAGWVGIPADDLRRYRADLPWLLAELIPTLIERDRRWPNLAVRWT